MVSSPEAGFCGSGDIPSGMKVVHGAAYELWSASGKRRPALKSTRAPSDSKR